MTIQQLLLTSDDDVLPKGGRSRKVAQEVATREHLATRGWKLERNADINIHSPLSTACDSVEKLNSVDEIYMYLQFEDWARCVSRWGGRLPDGVAEAASCARRAALEGDHPLARMWRSLANRATSSRAAGWSVSSKPGAVRAELRQPLLQWTALTRMPSAPQDSGQHSRSSASGPFGHV